MQLEAERADTATGTTIATGGTGSTVGSFDGGDSLKISSVNFGAGRISFAASVAVDPAFAGQTFQMRLDSPTGTSIGTVTGTSTGGWDKYTTQTQTITPTSGVHDVYLVGTGGAGIASIDWVAFE